MKKVSTDKGSTTISILVCAMAIIFVIMPVFSSVIEKYLIFNKAQIIKDALDITNIAAYNAINAESLSMNSVMFDRDKLEGIYARLLAENLNLDSNFFPNEGSVADERVIIDSVIVYTDGFPVTCPEGNLIKRPTVHSSVIVPVKPLLYGSVIMDMLKKEYVELIVHVDSEIPVDN
ncbi:MAG: hypothetical protein ACOX7R_01270 [Acetivibrionales bacterium]|jgi:hypothetical protein